MFKLARKGTTNKQADTGVNPDTGGRSSGSGSFTTIPTQVLPSPPPPPAEPGPEPEPSSDSAHSAHSRLSLEAYDHDDGRQEGQSTSGGSHDVAGSDYAKRCKALMELDNALRSLGANMFFDLPKIAVIGLQSAGKSSLVEAVSGINVPRDYGICTRCPVELAMSSFTKVWSCTISLRIEYDAFGNQQGESSLIPFCNLSIADKTKVDLWLRRAQASILWLDRPVSDFQNMELDELKRLKPGEGAMLSFTMNVIEVHLSDPEATDLSFVDLPGLIQNATEQEIAVIQNLVKKNIEGDKTLILVTIPMSDEMENQEAARLATQKDPSGDRTIGVLTKPDTILPGAVGSRQRWKDVMQGKAYPLRQGYYCVRLADDDERAKRLSRAESEQLSSTFFANTSPWSKFTDKSRFGVPNLVNDISRLLLRSIETNIPKLKVAVSLLIEQCSAELRAMPHPPTRDPSTEILLRVSDFCREVNEAVMGNDHKDLVHDNKSHYVRFKAAIERTNPDFWPFTSKENHVSPRLHVGGGSLGPLDLSDVEKEIKEALTWQLPGTIPFDAIKSLVLRSTSIWRDATFQCFDSVFESTSSAIEHLVARHFGQFTKLEVLMKTLTQSELELCKNETISLIEKILLHESVPLYTQNLAYLATEKSRWLQKYSNVHRQQASYYIANRAVGVPVPVWGHVQSHARSPSPQSYRALTRSPSPIPIDDLPKTYQDELSVMATVSAYFQVAFKRFVDHVPLAIEHQLNQLFSAKVHETLVEDIMSGPRVAEKMKDLLAEDEAVASRRQFLERRLARLREIRQKLYDFQLSS